MADHLQTLKCRDKTPVTFAMGEPPEQFKLVDGQCSWLGVDDSCGVDELRPRIEPWLTALFQSEHLSLLLGSGLTHAIHRLGSDQPLPGMSAAKFEQFTEVLGTEVERSAKVAGRREGNFEDQIRAASELLRGLEILGSGDEARRAEAALLREEMDRVLTGFATSILTAEQRIVGAAKRERAFSYLVSFLMSFASRTGTRDRLQVFTTNYDRVIEAGAEVAGLRLLDRFIGSLAPVFRSARVDVDMHYNPPGIRGEPRYLEGVARFTKLHGSIDWVAVDHSVRRLGIPFGASSIGSYLGTPNLGDIGVRRLMVYPNSMKDQETALYPYVELLRDFAAAVCRPNSTVVTYGYSFGDEHLNRVLADMLTIPSTHLVAISYDDPLGRIMDMYEHDGRQAQMSLLVGDHLGDLAVLVDNYLPKPAIDRTSIRMAELLRSRFGTGGTASGDGNRPSVNQAGPEP